MYNNDGCEILKVETDFIFTLTVLVWVLQTIYLNLSFDYGYGDKTMKNQGLNSCKL